MNGDIPDLVSVESKHRADASGGVTVDQTRTRLVNYTEFRVGHLVHPLDLVVRSVCRDSRFPLSSSQTQ